MIFWQWPVIFTLRGTDLLLTAIISPDLKHERNPLVRWMGWEWTIYFNIIGCIFAPFWQTFYWFLCIFSFLAILWNLHILKKIC